MTHLTVAPETVEPALTRAEVVDLMRTHWQDPADFHSEVASRLTIDESEYAPEDSP